MEHANLLGAGRPASTRLLARPGRGGGRRAEWSNDEGFIPLRTPHPSPPAPARDLRPSSRRKVLRPRAPPYLETSRELYVESDDGLREGLLASAPPSGRKKSKTPPPHRVLDDRAGGRLRRFEDNLRPPERVLSGIVAAGSWIAGADLLTLGRDLGGAGEGDPALPPPPLRRTPSPWSTPPPPREGGGPHAALLGEALGPPRSFLSRQFRPAGLRDPVPGEGEGLLPAAGPGAPGGRPLRRPPPHPTTARSSGSERITDPRAAGAAPRGARARRSPFRWYVDLRRYGSVPTPGSAWHRAARRLIAASAHLRETIPLRADPLQIYPVTPPPPGRKAPRRRRTRPASRAEAAGFQRARPRFGRRRRGPSSAPRSGGRGAGSSSRGARPPRGGAGAPQDPPRAHPRPGLGLSFSRVQCTPDLLRRSDRTSVLLEAPGGGREMRFQRGPVFANLLLVDEVNRGRRRPQSALSSRPCRRGR